MIQEIKTLPKVANFGIFVYRSGLSDSYMVATIEDRRTISQSQFSRRESAIARAIELETQFNLTIFEVV